MGPRPLASLCNTQNQTTRQLHLPHPPVRPLLLSFSPSINVLLLQLLLFFSLPSLVSPLHSNFFPLPSAISLLSSPFFPLPFSLSLVSLFPSPFSPAQPSILSANCYEFFLTLPLSLSACFPLLLFLCLWPCLPRTVSAALSGKWKTPHAVPIEHNDNC